MTSALVLTEEFQRALEHLNLGRHMFVTGKAGTGKSTLIRHFMAETTRNVVVVAPTGIAALNVGGYTIHRLFSLRPDMSVEYVRSPQYYPGRFAHAIKALDTLIIDEASMVRADLFDTLGAVLERFGPAPGKPFGGVQIVLVGDLYQLPPVVQEQEAHYFNTRYATPYFFSADRFTRTRFVTTQLTRVFRQAGDDRLTGILNAIREGTIDEESRRCLNTCTRDDFEPENGEFWLTLTTTNRIANARNRKALERLPHELHTWNAVVSGEIDQGSLPTEETLSYKVGAQVMLVVNDPGDRFVNGTLGAITAVGKTDEGEPAVTITTREGREVVVQPHTWEATRPVASGGRLVHEVIGTFRQLPFRLAWAITIHKSQGQTVDRLVVDLSGGTFDYGQLYVALSRCTSMAGLVLKRDVLPRDLKTDQRIRRFLTVGAESSARKRVYLGICSAGKVSQRTRPRPVEIAGVTADGRGFTTLVNPESDLYDSRTAYGIEAAEVVPAPRLAEAWPAILSLVEGMTPVGVDIDEQLEFIDHELKRNGVVAPMPLGISLPVAELREDERRALNSSTALARAQAARRIDERLQVADAFASIFPAAEHAGYLLPRGTGPEGIHVLGATSSDDRERLRHLARSRAEALRGGVSPASVLVPGARVCFTGSVVTAEGRTMDRSEMETMASERGLVIAKNVSKTRCDVLVCAEVGSQSKKARTARELGKPIVLAEDFLSWCG